MLLLAQIFATMPLHGVHSKSANNLTFHWIGTRMAYSLLVLFALNVMAMLSIYWAASTYNSIKKLGIHMLFIK